MASAEETKERRMERARAKAAATRAAKPVPGLETFGNIRLREAAEVLKAMARATGTVGANRALAAVTRELARRRIGT